MATLSPIIGAGLYAYGWLILSRFYGYFGVSPEEVGVGFAFLVVRVGVFMGIAAVLLFILSRVLQPLQRVRWVVELKAGGMGSIPPNAAAKVRRAFGGIVLAFMGGGVVGWLVDTAASALGHPQKGKATLGGNIFAGIFLVVPFIFYFGPRLRAYWCESHPGSVISFGKAVKVVNRAVLALFFLGFVVLIWWAPLQLEHGLRGGMDLSHSPVLRTVGLDLERVRLALAPGQAEETMSPVGCVYLLGSAAGTTIVYEQSTNHTYRLPSTLVTLSAPC